MFVRQKKGWMSWKRMILFSFSPVSCQWCCIPGTMMMVMMALIRDSGCHSSADIIRMVEGIIRTGDFRVVFGSGGRGWSRHVRRTMIILSKEERMFFERLSWRMISHQSWWWIQDEVIFYDLRKRRGILYASVVVLPYSESVVTRLLLRLCCSNLKRWGLCPKTAVFRSALYRSWQHISVIWEKDIP